jgi:adenylate cyclase
VTERTPPPDALSPEPGSPARLPPAVQPVRVLVWVFHLGLPMAGLWLLLAQPRLDLRWHDPASHFWLVLGVAVVSTLLGVWVSTAARRRDDARLVLVSMAFLASAGFFAVHAIATPGVLVDTAVHGFHLAQPVGLAVSAGFALVSSLSLSGRRAAAVLRHQVLLWVTVAGLCAAWTVLSLLDVPPLNQPGGERDVEGPMIAVAVAAVVAYLVAAFRYYRQHRRQPSAVLLSIITSFVLLAEAMVATTLAGRWLLSWWEWHLLLVFAFGFVGYSAWVQYRREGSAAGLFDAVALAETTRRIQAAYEAALEELVAALRRREEGAPGSSGAPVAARLADRFDLSEGQAAVLERAGAALAHEREVSARLAALVSVGEQARVAQGEEELLAALPGQVRAAYGPVSVALVKDGTIDLESSRLDPGALGPAPVTTPDGATIYPLTVRGRVAGVLSVPSAREPALEAALANQVSVALENARLYRELDALFRAYLSPDVAAALLADPGQADLGGSLVEVTALFADLRGFTTFSEAVEPAEIVRMLNRYHGVAVPCILDHGGTVVQFVGDALLALFNAPARQADHAARAIRAALAMQQGVEEIAAAHPGWPRFRVGANTGPALVGNIGSDQLRGFNAMGDAVNVAARLQGLAGPGQVVIGETTRAAAGDGLPVRSLGDLQVKGREAAVRAYVVTGPPVAPEGAEGGPDGGGGTR